MKTCDMFKNQFTKYIKWVFIVSLVLVSMTGCSTQKDIETQEEKEEVEIMNLEVNGKIFEIELEQNEAVNALCEELEKGPLSISMEEYGGFEKVGSLGRTLPSQDIQMTTQAGDVVLYQSNQIVIFMGSNSWSYTRLGKVKDLTGWKDALGSGSVTITLSL